MYIQSGNILRNLRVFYLGNQRFFIFSANFLIFVFTFFGKIGPLNVKICFVFENRDLESDFHDLLKNHVFITKILILQKSVLNLRFIFHFSSRIKVV